MSVPGSAFLKSSTVSISFPSIKTRKWFSHKSAGPVHCTQDIIFRTNTELTEMCWVPRRIWDLSPWWISCGLRHGEQGYPEAPNLPHSDLQTWQLSLRQLYNQCIRGITAQSGGAKRYTISRKNIDTSWQRSVEEKLLKGNNFEGTIGLFLAEDSIKRKNKSF